MFGRPLETGSSRYEPRSGLGKGNSSLLTASKIASEILENLSTEAGTASGLRRGSGLRFFPSLVCQTPSGKAGPSGLPALSGVGGGPEGHRPGWEVPRPAPHSERARRHAGVPATSCPSSRREERRFPGAPVAEERGGWCVPNPRAVTGEWSASLCAIGSGSSSLRPPQDFC